MASLRPQQPRRNESFSRPTRDDVCLKPTAGPYDNVRGQDYGGERRSDYTDHSRSSHRRSWDAQQRESRYDPRYSYPPRRSPSRARKRRSWPPRPCVEDEVTSLRKEAGTDKLLRQVPGDDAVSRGSIDQEPIIEDVCNDVEQKERREAPKRKETTSTGGLPTPPSSEDERQRRDSRRPSRLNMDFKQPDQSVPEMGKRTSTPYSFSQSAQTPQPPPDSRFLSPDVISPPQTSRRVTGSRSQPSSPRRDSARYSPSTKSGRDYFAAGHSGYSGDESAIDDTAYDTCDSVGSTGSGRGRPSTYPRPRGKKLDEPRASPDTSVVDFATVPTPKDVPIRKANLDARRNTETSNTLPTLARLGVEKGRRPTPLASASALSDLDDCAVYSSPPSPRMPSELPLPRSREPSYVSSRGPSPSTLSEQRRSPRFSADYFREQSSTSSPASKAPSVDGSRPASPSPRTPGDSPRLPRTDLDWSALMAANAARRPKTSSRLATSQLQTPDMPDAPAYSRPDIARSYSAAPQPRASTTPYPTSEGPTAANPYVPGDRKYQYAQDQADRSRVSSEKRATLQAPFLTDARSASYTAPPNTYSDSYGHVPSAAAARPARPAMRVRHSTAELPPMEFRQDPERPGTSDSKRSSYSSAAPRREDLQALMRRKIPSCRRPDPIAGKDDWYTLSGASSLDFCPDCVRDNFAGTKFDREIKRSPRYNRDARIQCALSQPWIRLAFLLTLQRERLDLGYLKDLAEIDRTTNACPGNQEDHGPWYGLRDNDNFFVKDFRVCYADVRKIERLFSSLSGQFVRQPERFSYTSYRCAMRPETNRFWPYLGTLSSIHDQSMSLRKQADIAHFIDFVDRKMRSPECTRDTFLTGGLWHFIPSLPEFTVCGECFESVVFPEIQKRKDLAMRFGHTLQPAPLERNGSSCMLYSRRTRRWFKDAVDDNDMKYLTQRARSRRDKEIYLQDKYKDVQRRMNGLGADQNGRDELRRLEREVQWIAEEWQKVE